MNPRKTKSSSVKSVTPEASLVQLPAPEASGLAKVVAKQNATFQTFKTAFEKQGFKFLPERVKAFVYFAPTEKGVSTGTFAIFPSLIPAKPTDPFHRAVGLCVHSSGGVAAASVKVGHKPFAVTEFTVHELEGTRLESRTISTADLEKLTPAKAASVLGPAKINLTAARRASVEGPSDKQLETIIATAFDQIIHDRYASPLYTPAAMTSLLRQKPTIVRFAYANRARYAAGGLTQIGFACSCTCCNGCTTTSFTLSISA